MLVGSGVSIIDSKLTRIGQWVEGASMITAETVKKLLNDANLPCEEVEDPKADFNFACNYQDRRAVIHFVHPDKDADHIVAIAALGVGDDLWDAVCALPNKDKAIIYAKTKQAWLQQGISYAFTYASDTDEIPRHAQVQITIRNDELNWPRVAGIMTTIDSSLTLFIAVIEEVCGILPRKSKRT